MPSRENIMRPPPHRFCHSCGSEYEDLKWPRLCQACGAETYRNPIPAASCLVPVGNGLLAVYRAIPPFGLALPGGFVEHDESWQEAAVRELNEELQVRVSPDEIQEYRTISSSNGILLVFGLAPAMEFSQLPDFVPNDEVSGRNIIVSDKKIVFPIHAQVIREYFGSRP